MTEKEISVSSLSNLSQDQLTYLYSNGYRIANNFNASNDSNISNNSNNHNKPINVQNLGLQHVSAWQYFWLGIFSYASYKSFQSDHTIWGIIFAFLAMSSANGIYSDIKR